MTTASGAGGDSADTIFRLILRGRERQASDLHVEPGHGAAFRIFTRVERVPDVPHARAVSAFLDLTIDRLSRSRLEKNGIADSVYADERIGAIRIHATRGRNGPRLAVRLLARSIPEFGTLRLPESVAGFTSLRSGLLLFAGPTGSGKSTTIASLLDRINDTQPKHIITFEDPIEYTHRWQTGIVTQYEIGRDVASFAEGVRGALRADPDILFIGELRTLETTTACLQAAESGHLVFAALHTPSETPHAVNRIVGLFAPAEQENARLRLADSLRALVGLRLVPLRDGSGLRAAAEVVIANEAVRRLIRDGNGHQLRAMIATSRRDGMQTLESHLSEMLANGEIDLATARSVSLFPDEVRDPVTPFRRH